VKAVIPNPADADFLMESHAIASLETHPGWGKLKQRMAELVAEAKTDCDESLSDDPNLGWKLHWRWRQRRDMMVAVIATVEATANERKRLLDELYGEDVPPEPTESSYPIPAEVKTFMEGK